MLEKLLCSMEEASTIPSSERGNSGEGDPDLDDFVYSFYSGYPNCKDFIADFYTVTRNNGSNMDEIANDAVLILEQDDKREKPGNAGGSGRAGKEKKEKGSKVEVTTTTTTTATTATSRPPTSRHDSSGSSDFYSCEWDVKLFSSTIFNLIDMFLCVVDSRKNGTFLSRKKISVILFIKRSLKVV